MLEDKHTTGEISEQDQQLVQYLERMLKTRSEDAQSLDRIRERLLKLSEGSLPVSTTAPSTLKTRSRGAKMTNVRFIHSTYDKKRPWLRLLSAIAAVLIVAIIVGSLALLLTRLRQDTTGNGSRVFSQRQGWMQLALYSGRGSKTITGLNIEPPRLWGTSNACIGTGKLDIELTGPQSLMSLGRDRCQIALSTIITPQSISIETSASTPQIQTIKVTVDADTTWYLEIEQAVQQPTLTIGSEWTRSIGIGGNGGGVAKGNVGKLTKPNGQVILPKTWAVVFVCIGTGNGHFEFTSAPSSGKISIPPCDGQPRLILVRYRAITAVQEVAFFINGDIVWTAQVLGCTDERKCTS